MGFNNDMGILLLLVIYFSASPAESERITLSPLTLSIYTQYFDFESWAEFKAFSGSRTELVVSNPVHGNLSAKFDPISESFLGIQGKRLHLHFLI
jgi:hypothetical protein